jgi:hypothetical protein
MMKNQEIINSFCPTCKDDITSHSFNLITHTLEGGHIFLTKIADATKYSDTDGIVSHCRNFLNYTKPDKWIWIIDFKGFGIKHTLGISTGIQLTKLVNTFGRLQQLIVINTNIFVEQMLKIIRLTLRDEFQDRIYILHSRDDDFFKNKMLKWTHTDAKTKNVLNELL